MTYRPLWHSKQLHVVWYSSVCRKNSIPPTMISQFWFEFSQKCFFKRADGCIQFDPRTTRMLCVDVVVLLKVHRCVLCTKFSKVLCPCSTPPLFTPPCQLRIRKSLASDSAYRRCFDNFWGIIILCKPSVPLLMYQTIGGNGDVGQRCFDLNWWRLKAN